MRWMKPVLAVVLGCSVAPLLHAGCASFTEAAPDDAGPGLSDADATVTVMDAGAEASPYAEAVLADSPVAYWRLDETSGPFVHSLVGGETYKATVLGTPMFGAAGALANETDTALRFDADAGQAVDVGASFDFVKTESFSLEAWVDYRDSDTSFRNVFSKDGNDDAGREAYGIYLEGVAPEAFLVFERWVGGQKKSIDAPANGSGTIPPLVPKSWHHIVAVYDGAQLALYIDGQPAGTTPDARPQPSKSERFYFGAHTAMLDTLHGDLDEVAVYATALTPEQVKTHFELGSAPP